ncbi:MAG: type II secretion system protein GspG [bacterium]
MNQQTENRLVRHGSRSGFTLIEIMLVVVIIGILATGATFAIKGKIQEARRNTTRASLHAVKMAVANFEMHCGAYPNSLEELINNPGNDSWQGPYIEGKAIPRDSWGKDLQYSKSDDDFQLWAETPGGRLDSK